MEQHKISRVRSSGTPARKFAAVVSLDPAGSKPSGVCVRYTKRVAAANGGVTPPDWFREGDVWSPDFVDELTSELFAHTASGDRVALVVENAAFGSMKIARSIGTAIGAVKSALLYTGLMSPSDDIIWLTPAIWRKTVGLSARGRDAQKAAAVDMVRDLYDLDVGDNAAEGILLGNAALTIPAIRRRLLAVTQ